MIHNPPLPLTTFSLPNSMKSQILHHSSSSLFPIHSKAPEKSSSSSSSSLNNNNHVSAFLGPIPTTKKSLCFVVKSNHRDEDAIIVSDRDEGVEEDDEEMKMKNNRTGTGSIAAASVGLLALAVLMGQDKAWALGPEGPMVEEFWENVRRYALYALTVSTGVLYAVLQPIVELLKNPISAVFIILIIGGSFFIFSQILSAMFGVSDFAYQYAY